MSLLLKNFGQAAPSGDINAFTFLPAFFCSNFHYNPIVADFSGKRQKVNPKTFPRKTKRFYKKAEVNPIKNPNKTKLNF